MTTYTLWGSNPPGLPSFSTDFGNPTTCGTLFQVTEAGLYLVGYRWYVVDAEQTQSGVRFASWEVTETETGTVLAGSTVTSGALTRGTAPNDVMLAEPVALTASQVYSAVVGDNQHGPYTDGYFGSGGTGAAGVTSGPLFAFSDIGASAPDVHNDNQGAFQQSSNDPSSALPNEGFDASCFWVSPIISDSGSPPPAFSAAHSSTDGNGVQTWSVTSSLNNTGSAGAQNLRVLPPSSPNAGYPHAFLFMLPVEPGQGTSFGDSIATALALNAHNDYNLTIIQPGYATDPWYADNPNDSTTSQETFTLDVVTWVAANFSVTGTEKNYLIGFSKSGIGGQGLLFRHPAVFAACASWDAPFLMTDYDGTDPDDGTVGGGSAGVYGTSANFKNNYELDTANLTTWKATSTFGSVNRIWLGGYEAFQQDTIDYDTRLTTLGIKHTLGPMAEETHAWDTPWVSEALAAIIPATSSGGSSLFTAPGRSASYVQAESPLNILQTYDFAPSVLTGSATFTSEVIDLGPVPGFSRWRVLVFADQAGTCNLQQSSDGSTFYTTLAETYAGSVGAVYEALVAARYLRVTYVNGSSGQGSFRLLGSLVAI